MSYEAEKDGKNVKELADRNIGSVAMALSTAVRGAGPFDGGGRCETMSEFRGETV